MKGLVKPTILLVDDHAKYRTKVREGLELAGYKVVEAGSRDEALQQVQLSRPDLAIMDVRLVNNDDPNDFTGLRLLSELPKSLPTIILTAHRNPEAMANVYVLPDDVPRPKAFLFKDGELNTIILNVKLALRENRSARPVLSPPLRRIGLALASALLLFGIFQLVGRDFFIGVLSSLVASALIITIEKYFAR